MGDITWSRAFLILVLGIGMPVTAAEAAPNTYVSAVGNDDNLCFRASPCRTLARALAQTDPGGEIKVLDPGDYGRLTIARAVNIVADGPGEAAISVVAGTTGITIDAGPGDAIAIRGFTIKGRGAGTGIVFNSGKSLTIEDCVVRDLNSTGIAFRPASGTTTLVVSRTTVTSVGSRGIHVNPQSGATASVKALVHRSEVHNGTDIGIFAHGTGVNGTIDMTVSESVASGNAGHGMRANSLLGATTILTIIRSVSVNNGTGISAANADASVRVGQSVVTGNAAGWVAENGATLQSYGDNYVDGNLGAQAAMPVAGRK
jgi:hypothetical protein